MSKVLRCRDVGTDCGFEARGKTEEEILGVVSDHARKAHGKTNVPPDMVAKLRAAIREVPPAGGTFPDKNVVEAPPAGGTFLDENVVEEAEGSCGTTPSCGCH